MRNSVADLGKQVLAQVGMLFRFLTAVLVSVTLTCFDDFFFKVLTLLLAQQQEGVGQHGCSLFDAGDHIRTSGPVRLIQVGG